MDPREQDWKNERVKQGGREGKCKDVLLSWSKLPVTWCLILGDPLRSLVKCISDLSLEGIKQGSIYPQIPIFVDQRWTIGIDTPLSSGLYTPE